MVLDGAILGRLPDVYLRDLCAKQTLVELLPMNILPTKRFWAVHNHHSGRGLAFENPNNARLRIVAVTTGGRQS